MNKFRYVEYYGDGVEVYQCLACKERLYDSGCGLNWKFCPCCGMVSEGLLECRHHNVPRWVYDREGNNHNVRNPFCVTNKQESKWVVESRCKWGNSEWGEWKYDYSFARRCFGNLQEWKRVYNYLKLQKREDLDGFGLRWEYRVRIERL